MKIRVAINGFGRIGRQVAKLILAQQADDLQLVVVNTIEDIETCAFLLKYDSTQGVYPAKVRTEAANLLIDDNAPISFINCSKPLDLPWKNQRIDLVVDCSGSCGHISSTSLHLKAGAQKVLITAAAESDVTLCYGVNHASYDPAAHHLISASSCTTNCIAPVAKVLNDAFGIKSGMASFLHSYTNSQPVLDIFRQDLRRSRAAALNIIPTTTSAEHQLPLVIPALTGRFKALAIRVPTPIVHLADFTAKLRMNVSQDELLQALRSAAETDMRGIIALSKEPLVSIDHRKSTFSSIIDIEGTKSYNDLVKILIWHDNEVSYSSRVVDLISFIGRRI